MNIQAEIKELNERVAKLQRAGRKVSDDDLRELEKIEKRYEAAFSDLQDVVANLNHITMKLSNPREMTPQTHLAHFRKAKEGFRDYKDAIYNAVHSDLASEITGR